MTYSTTKPNQTSSQQAKPKQPLSQQAKRQKRPKRYKRFKSSKRFKPVNKRRLIAVISKQPKWKLPLPKETIDYKNVALLRKCITTEGKILPRRASGLNAKQQRQMAKAIKNCKLAGLLPFISKTR